MNKERKMDAKAILLGMVAIGLGGCITPYAPPEYEGPADKEIVVTRDAAMHHLSTPAGRLDRRELAKLGAFVASRGRPSSLEVALTPTSGDGHAGLPAVEEALIGLGVPADRISRRSGMPNAPLDIAVLVESYTAAVPGCPDWRRANLIDLSHLNSSNFGCATKAALAISVTDPKDLAEPRTLDGTHGAQALGAIDRYKTDQVKEFIEQDKSAFGGGGSSGGGGS